MMNIVWEKGLKGKTWRILYELNKNLCATIKTRYGPTREVEMEIGGKQGSRLTGRLFSKLMDTLAEEVHELGEGLQISLELIIGVLLWVDDVVSCVEGMEKQKNMLKIIDNFTKKNKLKWGKEKCKVMKIGKRTQQTEWNLGEIKIENCDSYKYLGDIISNNGKNMKNIEDRKFKLIASTISINTIAASEVLSRLETPILLDLHDKINIPKLLTNSEAWVLQIGEQKELERAEIQSLKSLFDLPQKTPIPAIVYTLGALFTNIRVDKKQLIYLHRLLNKNSSHWALKTLYALKDLNLGWYKRIVETLKRYQRSEDFDQIKVTPFGMWKSIVTEVTEQKNKEKLIEECHRIENNIKIRKTKTAFIVDELLHPTYQRKPKPEIMHLTKQETKTLITARYSMLECGKNYKGTMQELCNQCNNIDDEEHRLNYCSRFNDSNFYYDNQNEKIEFNTIFSNDLNALRIIIDRISRVWNVKTGHGTMHIT